MVLLTNALTVIDKRADWYVQDTSSEESEYEDDIKPLTTEAGALAVDDQMPGM